MQNLYLLILSGLFSFISISSTAQYKYEPTAIELSMIKSPYNCLFNSNDDQIGIEVYVRSYYPKSHPIFIGDSNVTFNYNTSALLFKSYHPAWFGDAPLCTFGKEAKSPYGKQLYKNDVTNKSFSIHITLEQPTPLDAEDYSEVNACPDLNNPQWRLIGIAIFDIINSETPMNLAFVATNGYGSKYTYFQNHFNSNNYYQFIHHGDPSQSFSEACQISNNENRIINEPNTQTVNIAPNPATDHIQILHSELIKSVEIFDLKGQLFIEQAQINSNTIDLDISNLSPALYIVKINKTIFKKIVIQ